MDKVILATCKHLIEEDNLDGLKSYFQEISELSPQEYRLPWEYIYQQVYLHACLRKKIEIVEWLRTLFDHFGDVEKIAIRQMFSYGKYLLHK